jgi:flagellar protein FlaG
MQEVVMSTEITAATAAVSGTRAVSANGDGFHAFVAPPAASVPSVPVASEPAAQEVRRADITEALEELVARAAASGASLDFRIDEDSGRVVVSVVDRRDGTVLRQMPSEEALRIARNLARYEPHLIEVRA